VPAALWLPKECQWLLRLLQVSASGRSLRLPEAGSSRRDGLLRLLQVPTALRLPEEGERLLRLLPVSRQVWLSQAGSCKHIKRDAKLQSALSEVWERVDTSG
jgi:hypothetical protein